MRPSPIVSDLRSCSYSDAVEKDLACKGQTVNFVSYFDLDHIESPRLQVIAGYEEMIPLPILTISNNVHSSFHAPVLYILFTKSSASIAAKL